MSAQTKKVCAICTPQCIRVCPVAERRSFFRKGIPCPQCGKRFLPGEESHCPSCELEIRTVCPECLAVNTMDDGVCSACGFMHKRVDPGPSPWYIYTPPERIGEYAPPPGADTL